MLKVTLVLIVLLVVSVMITKILLSNMTIEEKIVHEVKNEFPTRINIMGILILLLFIAIVVCGIITIITW